MSSISTRPDPFRRSAMRLRMLVSAATLSLALVLIAERLGYAGAYRGQGVRDADIAVQLVLSLPSILNLAALWSLRVAVSGGVEGRPFASAVAAAFRRMGALLAASSAAAILLVPLLARELGARFPRLIDADISTLVLGTIGFAMLFVGLLIDRAAAAERELQEFF